MMQLDNYFLEITPGEEQSSGYVLMTHGAQYTLLLRNNNSTRCDCTIEIDGKVQGTWRLNAFDSIRLERPAHDTGKFTFYQMRSSEAAQIGLNEGDSSLGLIKAVFTPEKKNSIHRPLYKSGFSDESKGISRRSFISGGTGLSSSSDQQFVEAKELELDKEKSVTIYLRLVGVQDSPRPLTVCNSTPIPPAIASF